MLGMAVRVVEDALALIRDVTAPTVTALPNRVKVQPILIGPYYFTSFPLLRINHGRICRR